MRINISTSFEGSDLPEPRAQRLSLREQIQLEPLTLEPLRQVPRKTQLVLARCTPRLALATAGPLHTLEALAECSGNRIQFRGSTPEGRVGLRGDTLIIAWRSQCPDASVPPKPKRATREDRAWIATPAGSMSSLSASAHANLAVLR